MIIMKKNKILLLLLSMALCLFMTNCTKDNGEDINPFTTHTNALFDHVAKVTGNSVTLYANFIGDDNTNVIEAGYICSQKENARLDTLDIIRIPIDEKVLPIKDSSVVKGLKTSNTYNVLAYLIIDTDTLYSASVTFTTSSTRDADAPIFPYTFEAYGVEQPSYDSAQLYGKVIEKGSGNIEEFGFCLSSENNEPTTEDTCFRVNDDLVEGSYFTVSATGLSSETTYYERIYVKTDIQTFYSDVVTFTTVAVPVTYPTISTMNVSDVARTTAKFSATVSDAGNIDVNAFGFVYGTSMSPTVDNSTKLELNDVFNASTFTSDVTNLEEGTTYYVRFYVSNTDSTVYSPQAQFTTTQITKPAVSIETTSNITNSTATINADVIEVGNIEVTSHGFVYNTSASPTVDNASKIELTADLKEGNVSYDLENLSAATTYYVRYYVTTADEIIYSDETSFETLAGDAEINPIFSLTEVKNITSSEAKCVAIVKNIGNKTVAEYGFCYGTSENPTVDDTYKSIYGTLAAQKYSQKITGLTAQTTYYVRFYVKLDDATVLYSTGMSFTTKEEASGDNPFFDQTGDIDELGGGMSKDDND